MPKTSPDVFVLVAEAWTEPRLRSKKDHSLLATKPKVKGTIYWDHSKKGVNSFGSPKFHNAFRTTVTYNGKTYRKRSIDRGDCKRFLEKMAKLYAEGKL